MLEGVRSAQPIQVVWEGDKRYRGGTQGGATLVMDGDRVAGPSPVESMLVSLASCSAIDVVEILEKRRTPVTSLSALVDFSRAATAPRRLTEISIHFLVGTASELHHVQRAVELSIEKYCSVASSLAPDTTLTWTVEVTPPVAPRLV